MKSKILIVDDSPLIRCKLRSLLEEQGLTVCGEAENGLDAIAKARRLRPDLIVLDLSMPVMNGLQAARQLRQLMPSVRLLMFTGFTSPSLTTEALAVGIDTVRDKSEVATLVSSIHQLLNAA